MVGSSDSFDFFIVLFSRRTTLKANSLQFETAVEKYNNVRRRI